MGLLVGILGLGGCQPAAKGAAVPAPLPSPAALPRSAFRVEWKSADVPKAMTAGRSATVAVGVKNAGDTIWPDRAAGHPSGNGIGAVRLAYRWWRAGSPATLVADYRPTERTDLPTPLAPGTATTLTIAVEPPSAPGRYLLQLEMVQEMISWFEAQGADTLKIPVLVREADTSAASAPRVSRPPVFLAPAAPDQRALTVLLAALAFIVAVPLAFGYLVPGGRDHVAGAERLAWTYVIGFAALVFALSAAATFLPARIHGPALAAGSVVSLVSIRSARRRVVEDLRLGWRPAAVVAVIAALGMVALNWPSVVSGDTVFFDGHGNHDGFYNAGNASWLLDHNARAIPEWSVASPLFFPVLDLIGMHSVVARLGAESLLAAAAATTGHDPIEIYLPLLSSLLVPWLATAFLVARRGWPSRRFPTPLAILVGALQPVFIFFFANGNFPNLVGLLPCTLLLLLFRWQQTEARPPFGLVAIALATAAPLATYPEVLAVTSVGLGILVLASLWSRLPLARTARAALGMAAGVALNPLVARRAWGGLHTAVGADSSIAGGAPWFAMVNEAQLLPAAVTLSFHAAKALPIVLAVVVSLCLLAAIVVAWRRMDDPALAWAAVVPLAAVCGLGWHRNMTYAYQKGVQWTALLLCVLLAVGIMECLRPWTAPGMRRTALGLGRAAAGTICTLWLAAASVCGMRSMLAVAAVKRIDSAFRAVADMAEHVPPGAAIAVRDLPLGADGFFAMWIPYFIRDHPVFFEWGKDTANYLTVVVSHSARVPLSRPPYVLVPAGSPGPGETPIVGNRRFWLLARNDGATPQPDLGWADDVPLSVNGISTITAVGHAEELPDGGFAVPAGSKPIVIGAAYVLNPHTCPPEVHLGLADAQGTVVLVTPAERFVRYGYVSTKGFSPDDACGFRARFDTARLRPGTYYFRTFQLTPDRGFYTNPVEDPRLIVKP